MTTILTRNHNKHLHLSTLCCTIPPIKRGYCIPCRQPDCQRQRKAGGGTHCKAACLPVTRRRHSDDKRESWLLNVTFRSVQNNESQRSLHNTAFVQDPSMPFHCHCTVTALAANNGCQTPSADGRRFWRRGVGQTSCF